MRLEGGYMKVVVVGGVAGGASAAARIRRLDASAQSVMLEKGEHVSFSNCCLPYHLSGTIEKSSSLVLMTPESAMTAPTDKSIPPVAITKVMPTAIIPMTEI